MTVGAHFFQELEPIDLMILMNITMHWWATALFPIQSLRHQVGLVRE